jgi:hypothetical protein
MLIYEGSDAGNIGSLSAVDIGWGVVHPKESVSLLLYIHANSNQESSTRGLVGRCAGEAVTPRLNKQSVASGEWIIPSYWVECGSHECQHGRIGMADYERLVLGASLV